MQLIERLKRGWTPLKFIRVGLGGLILYSSVQNGEMTGIILGGLLTVFALFTDGVCCSSACSVPGNKNKVSLKEEDVEYEELGTK
ncbi:MAG: hypothetical protein JNK14_10615 [Chitinophagaceae bacterium]|nr:hypothetical protein [Chitinophagaceae bacterium]